MVKIGSNARIVIPPNVEIQQEKLSDDHAIVSLLDIIVSSDSIFHKTQLFSFILGRNNCISGFFGSRSRVSTNLGNNYRDNRWLGASHSLGSHIMEIRFLQETPTRSNSSR